MKLLALDYGTVRIGVAFADTETNVAVPIVTLNAKEAFKELKRIIAHREVDALVVGLPVTLAGEEGETAQAARAFGKRFAEETGLPVHFFDERFTSTVAGQGGAGLKERDASAAAVLLNNWLDRQKR